jgi:hypothetical protein
MGLVAKNICISIFPSLGGNKDYYEGVFEKQMDVIIAWSG